MSEYVSESGSLLWLVTGAKRIFQAVVQLRDNATEP
jgi:hypothetical protein